MAETNAPEGLTLADLDDKLFSQIAKGCGLKLKSWKQLDIGDSSEDGLTSVVTTAADNDKELEGILTGICFFEITGTSLNQESDCEVKKKVALKAKLSPLQTNMSIAKMFAMSYEMSEKEILEILAPFSTGAPSSAKEIEVARWSFSEKAAASIMPKIYYTECDKTTPYFVMEFFEPEIMENIDTPASKLWTREKRCNVLRDIANLHATYLGRTDRLDGTKIKPLLSDLSAVIAGGKKLWKAGLTVASRQHPDVVTPSRAKLLHSIIDNLASEISPYLSQFPQTVVHGDLHAGNLCLRKNPSNGESHLCAYDWEYCSLHVPQRDMAYFLISTLPVMESASEHLALWQEYTDFFRNELISALERAENVNNPQVEKLLQKETFQKIADYAIMESVTDMVCFTGSLPPAFALASWNEVAGNALLYIEAVKDQYKFLQN